MNVGLLQGASGLHAIFHGGVWHVHVLREAVLSSAGGTRLQHLLPERKRSDYWLCYEQLEREVRFKEWTVHTYIDDIDRFLFVSA